MPTSFSSLVPRGGFVSEVSVEIIRKYPMVFANFKHNGLTTFVNEKVNNATILPLGSKTSFVTLKMLRGREEMLVKQTIKVLVLLQDRFISHQNSLKVFLSKIILRLG